MAGDDPLFEVGAGGVKAVDLHAPPRPGALERFAVGDAAVDENVFVALQRERHGTEIVKFRRERLAQPCLERDKLGVRGERFAKLGAHFENESAARRPLLAQEMGERPRVPFHVTPVHPEMPEIAVAEHRVHPALFPQRHGVAERGKALRPFFHQIAEQHERVVGAQMELFHETAKIREIPVDVRHGDDARMIVKRRMRNGIGVVRISGIFAKMRYKVHSITIRSPSAPVSVPTRTKPALS